MRKINSSVLEGSVSGPILLLIYINDLPDGIMSIYKIFADDTLFFENTSKIIDPRNSQNTLNSDLKGVKDWA